MLRPLTYGLANTVILGIDNRRHNHHRCSGWVEDIPRALLLSEDLVSTTAARSLEWFESDCVDDT